MAAAPSASLTLGLHYHRAGRLAEAEEIYREVLAAEPDNADALHLFGVLAHQVGQHGIALEAISLAIHHAPDRADFHSNLGDVYRTLQLYPEAWEVLTRSLALDGRNAAAHNNLGLVLQALGRRDEAAASYQRALELEPVFPEAHNNLGNAWKELRQPGPAEASYRKALAQRPGYPEAHHNLGGLLQETGRRAEAVAAFTAALALRPDYPQARFGRVMAELPVIYRDAAEIDQRRAAYREALVELDAYVDHEAGDPVRLTEAAGSHQPFFLAYQGRGDRELQALWGGVVGAAMARRFPAAEPSPPPAAGGHIRVGIVSGYFCHHSVWKMPIRGWLSQLDRRRFRVNCYHTRAQRDAATLEAEGLADRFIQGPLPLEHWRTVILADAPDVLIYPELGMDAVTAQLAGQRLARLQCTSWGHPVTSGYPSVDAYLSSALMEPPEAQDHYTERLVRLPGLSVYYEPVAVSSVASLRGEFGLRPGAVVYWSGQSLYKYLPQYDEVFARIAGAVGDCQFVFIDYGWGGVVNEVFRGRLRRAFAALGLESDDYCVFLPPLGLDRFVAVIGLCDVVLDSIGWSGCNSTLESLTHDLPIVTLPGALMRGRHSMAILTMIGVAETIAASLDDYVGLAVRLARDPGWRAGIRSRIAERKHRVYRDRSCIEALEAFLEQSVRG
ncbi:MAG: tetratricopeptide repeat protein [Rhodospirillaceae bacterium]